MREIKFRGKSKPLGEWKKGSLWLNNEQALIIPSPIYDDDEEDQNVILETVGQFTGLKDKNGVQIFEGDRILYQNSLEHGEGVITFHLGFNIEWDLNTVVTSNPSLISPLFYFGCEKEIEVIGNIHDNPELINR